MLEMNVTIAFPAAPLLTVILALVGKILISITHTIFLAHHIEKSYVLPHVRNSYFTLVISPQAHPEF